MNTHLPLLTKLGLRRSALPLLLLSASALHSQVITNPSFEIDTFAATPGTIAANAPITGWVGSPADRVGIARGGVAGTLADNGTIPDGSQVAFLTSSPDEIPATLSTTITGLVPGTTYKVSFRANASHGTANQIPTLFISTDAETPSGTDEVGMIVSRVSGGAGGTEPYHLIAYEFIASSTSHVLTLENNLFDTDKTLLVDHFSIATSSEAWKFSHWTGDGDSGVGNNFGYTHAYLFNNLASPLINNVQFTGLGEFTNPPNTTIVGLGLRVGNQISRLEFPSGSATMAESFRYNTTADNQLSITLNNLEPSTRYTFSLYGMGWGPPGERASTFTSNIPGSDALTVDLNQFGDREGLIVNYTYTTDATGSPVTISYLPTNRNLPNNIGNTFHTSGFSNRTADPLAGAPTIAAEPQSAVVAFSDTHSFKVIATGSELSYQWRKDSTDLEGQNSDTLTLSDITLDNAGVYTVVISNSAGSITSAPVTLTVKNRVSGLFGTGFSNGGLPNQPGLSDPHYVLVANPNNPGKGTTPVFTILPTSRPSAWLPNTETYQWAGPARNVFGAAGVDTSDAGEAAGSYVYQTTLDLTNFDPASVVVTGRWATDNAGLSIRINGADTGFRHEVGNTFASFSSFRIDSSNATFVSGINTIQFVLRNDENNSSTPRGGWTGLLVADLDAFGDLPDGTALRITNPPVDTIATPFDFVTGFYVGATGTGPISYQWHFNGSPIEGATSPFLRIEQYTTDDEGSYHVTVSNSVGTIQTTPVTLTVTNRGPIPGDLSYQVNAGNTVVIGTDVIIGAAFDVEFDPFTLTAVADTSTLGGSVLFEQTAGRVTYTPPAGIINGNDSFTYTLTDQEGNVSTGTIKITIGIGDGEPEPEDPDLGSPGFTFTTGAGASATVSIQVTAAGNYAFQRSVDLTTWNDLQTRTIAQADLGSLEFSDSAPPAGRAFYRIIRR